VGALYFNPSLRTRASFEQAVRVVGGGCQTLNTSVDTWALEFNPNAVMDGVEVENIVEAARVLGQFFHVLGVRSFRGTQPWAVERTEPVLRRIAEHAGVPVISLEGTTHHPCQSLADVLTLRETFGSSLTGLPVALTWAWHPKALPMAVPHSFLLQAALAGCDVSLVHPPGFDLDAEVVEAARTEATRRGGAFAVHHDRAEGLRGRKVVYVKSWGRMDAHGGTDPGLRDWLVDESALRATDGGKVMHCLPVRRNVVIAGDVLDGPRSLVTQQAGNRLWAQAALIEHVARRSGVLS
jgi:N-acetylornithine carbamoyltransferase